MLLDKITKKRIFVVAFLVAFFYFIFAWVSSIIAMQVISNVAKIPNPRKIIKPSLSFDLLRFTGPRLGVFHSKVDFDELDQVFSENGYELDQSEIELYYFGFVVHPEEGEAVTVASKKSQDGFHCVFVYRYSGNKVYFIYWS